MEDLRFALLVMLALTGWALWLFDLHKECYLQGFGNWFVRRLYRTAQWLAAIAAATDHGLVEYRRVMERQPELFVEYVEVTNNATK